MGVGSSLQVCFKNLSERTGCGIEVDGFDSNGGVLDWSKTETWEAVVQQARRRAWDVCIMMPPSSTYSRARHRQDGQHGGPKPLRNRLYPDGFPWLAKQHVAAVELENSIISQCLNLAFVLTELQIGWLLLHPEDLGRLKNGDNPASIWQRADVRSILDQSCQARTWVVHLCRYGAEASHPTRAVTNLRGGPRSMPWPMLDGQDCYQGPLGRCGHDHALTRGRLGSRWATQHVIPSGFLEFLAELAYERVSDDRATDASFQGAEDFARSLLERQRRIEAHDGEALSRLLPFEAPHPAVQKDRPSGGRAFFAGAFCKGPFFGLRQSCHTFPAAVQCFATLLRQAFPGQVFSSLAVFDNVAAAMHKDSRNAPYPNLLFALTRFRGGEVWCESSTGTVFRSVRGLDRPGILLPVADAPQTLMAHEVFHQTEPWKGDRLLLVGFTVQRTLELSLVQLQLLQSLGFVMPPSHLKQGGHDDDDKPRTSPAAQHACSQGVHDDNDEPRTSPASQHTCSLVPNAPALSTPAEAAASQAPVLPNTPAGGPIWQAPVNTPVEGPTSQAVKEDTVDVLSSKGSCDEAEDFDASTSRCRGPAIRCRHTKAWRELVDGFGLCSPGRWRPLARDATASSSEWEHSEAVREILLQAVRESISDARKAAFALATGRMLQSPFSSEVLRRVREQIAALLPDRDAALEVPGGQPFFLHLLSQSLEILGDPDYRILDHGDESFAQGVPLGWDRPLPRTPQVFPKRTTFRKLDQTDFDPSMLNYRSAEMNADQLEEKFREDERAGLMLCTTEAEATQRFGAGTLLIAAMGALIKANGDVRPLHDGTHGINLNNRIRILDKLQVPGPEDLQEVASRVKESKEAPFALCADIKQAHRNVKVRESDWPKLGCKSSSSSRVLWLNRVGTFGVSSAAYHWTRLFATVGRWAFRILHLDKFYMLIYVDDLHVIVYGGEKFRTLWALFLALEVVGTPFAYHKFKGGLEVDYIGYHLDYFTWTAGISAKRSAWIVEWVSRAEASNWTVVGRQLIEFIGRLNFVTRMLAWMKPFLAPLYAWQSAIGRGTVAQLPDMVVLVLRFFRYHFENGARLDSVQACWPATDRQAFRTDAKCEKGRIVLGGWSLERGLNTKEAQWFILDLTPQDVPALFKDDLSSEWASTSAELLGSYAGLVAFGHASPAGGRDRLKLQICAGTDNKATPAITARGLSNKWPVQGIHMQLATTMRQANKICKLDWRPREENQDADDLTNHCTRNFTPELQVPLTMKDIPMDLFEELHESYGDFKAAKELLVSSKTGESKATKRQKLLDKTEW